MNYDLTIHTPDGEPVLLIKYLIRWRGWELNLHKIVRPDEVGCFHTHPANAWRLILWGGYIEQLSDFSCVFWDPGKFGKIRPEFEHRIAYLYGKASYTLWLRAPVTAAITTRGCSNSVVAPDEKATQNAVKIPTGIFK